MKTASLVDAKVGHDDGSADLGLLLHLHGLLVDHHLPAHALRV